MRLNDSGNRPIKHFTKQKIKVVTVLISRSDSEAERFKPLFIRKSGQT